MTEHEKIPKHEVPGEEKSVKKTDWSAHYLPISIIVAAILIAGSSLYNTRVMLQGQNFEGGSAIVKSGSVNNNAQVAAPLPDSGEPVAIAERKDAPVLGKSSAKVTIVEFSDFQCPFCEKFFSESYGKIKSEYVDSGKVKFEFRHYPLPFHQNAQKSAEAAECANRQNKFFEYHDLLFKNGKSDGTGLAIEDLKKYADQLGLNKSTLGFGANKFNQCLDKGETADVIKKDMADATSAGVSGTPTLFVNGKKIVGAQPYDNFKQAIDAALK